VRVRILLPGVPLVVAALVAGCSSGQTADGPLGHGGDGGYQCVPARYQQATDTIGLYILDNGGKSPVKITGIAYPHNHGLRMTSAWLVPIGHQGGDTYSVGIASTFPATYSALARRVWSERVPLIGAVIKPGQALNLVFGMGLTMKHAGSSAGPKISYTSAGSRYYVQEQFSLQMDPKTCNG
jgi:hypothetical protein